MEYAQIKKRYNGIQSKLENISKYGCLFLSLCTIIEEVTNKEADLIGMIQQCKSKGWVRDDYTVEDSLALLNAYTGKEWKRKILKVLPETIKENEFTIEKWYNPKTKGNHFKRRTIDTVTNSNTCRIGGIECYYVYSYK